jgi:hypothetical protein
MISAMPLPVIAGTVRCAVQGTMPNGQAWVNVWHARYSTGASSPGAADITNLDNLLLRIYSGTAFTTGTPWLTLCYSGVKMTQINYTPLDGTSLSTQIVHTPAGTGGTTSLPPEVAHVLTLRTAQRGRSHRGRIYMPAMAQSNIAAAGDVSPSFVTNFLTQLTGVMGALGNGITAPFWELGVASYKNSYFTPLANPTMDLHPDVQRRRRM